MVAAIGVDIGGHGLKAVAVDAGGAVLNRATRPLRRDQRSVESVEAAVVGLVAVLRAALRTPDVPVGVGIPGFHDHVDGVLRGSPNFPGWEDLRVADRLSALLGAPVVTENDANVAVLGEAWVGGAAGLDDVVMLTLGTGVGTGILVGGRLLTGARGAGAEGGHLPLHPGGRPCGCGRLGCLEAYVSGPGFTRTGREEHARAPAGPCPERPEDIIAAAHDGAAWAIAARDRFVADLAQGLVPFVHLFSPQAIVLGGGVAGAFDSFAPEVERALTAAAIPACLLGVLPLRPALLGGDAGAVGAARLAIGSPR